jgi:hypothetical protein
VEDMQVKGAKTAEEFSAVSGQSSTQKPSRRPDQGASWLLSYQFSGLFFSQRSITSDCQFSILAFSGKPQFFTSLSTSLLQDSTLTNFRFIHWIENLFSSSKFWQLSEFVVPSKNFLLFVIFAGTVAFWGCAEEKPLSGKDGNSGTIADMSDHIDESSGLPSNEIVSSSSTESQKRNLDKQRQEYTGSKNNEFLDVKFGQLVSNPKLYDGKKVRLECVYIMDDFSFPSLVSQVFLHPKDNEFYARSLDIFANLSLNKSDLQKVTYSETGRTGHMKVMVEGIFKHVPEGAGPEPKHTRFLDVKNFEVRK